VADPASVLSKQGDRSDGLPAESSCHAAL